MFDELCVMQLQTRRKPAALYRFAIGDLIEQRHAVGFRPEA
jgi:hypothetical protein